MLALQTQCYWCRSIEIRQLFADGYLNKSRKRSVYWISMYFSNKELSCCIVSSLFSAVFWTFNDTRVRIIHFQRIQSIYTNTFEQFFRKILPQMYSIDFFKNISASFDVFSSSSVALMHTKLRWLMVKCWSDDLLCCWWHIQEMSHSQQQKCHIMLAEWMICILVKFWVLKSRPKGRNNVIAFIIFYHQHLSRSQQLVFFR